MSPQIHSDAEVCVEAVLSQVGREIVLVMPIALGKPNNFVNALYARVYRAASHNGASCLSKNMPNAPLF